MDQTPAWLDELLRQIEAIRPRCPRVADMAYQWAALATEWLQTERRLGFPGGKTAEWVERTGAPDLMHYLQRAAREPAMARWLEEGIPEFGLGVYMATLKDHEEQGIWVVDFPSAVGSVVREFDRSDVDGE